MLAYRTPGVYLERSEPPARVRALRTDVAGLVGIAARGPLQRPVRVEGWPEFVSVFGGHTAQGYLAYAVEGFFANGGDCCWVVRVADPAAARPGLLELVDEDEQPALRLTATSPGVWSRQLAVRLTGGGGDRFHLVLRLPRGPAEAWPDLSVDPGDSRYAPQMLAADPRRLATAEVVGSGKPPDPRRPQPLSPAGGRDGLTSLRPEHFSAGLAALETVDEVSLVAVPDILPKPWLEPYCPPPPEARCDVLDEEPVVPPFAAAEEEMPPAFDDDQIAGLQAGLVAHCRLLGDRFALVDVPRFVGGRPADPETARGWRRRFDTSYAALYYPWLRLPDPLRLTGLLRDVPPSGHVAGVCARVDRRTGVHKPPANELLRGVEDLTFAVGGVEHGRLTSGGVNALIAYPGRGLRVAGARTVASDSEWRYVNVRRLLLMIREAIEGETRWTVFEPHNPELWREIERVVRGFLDRLWRRGMLDGASAEAAYEVRCDETTNPPEEQERGRVVCTVGVQPPWPAEFVVVRLGKTEGGIEILAEGRSHG